MFYCESCRVKNKWPRPLTYPYHSVVTGRCEICHKYKENYDVPSLFLKSEQERSKEELLLDKIIQNEYKLKAEGLVITFVKGPKAGSVNHFRTEELKMLTVKVKDEIDWYATYQLRCKAQEGYRRTELENK